MNIKPLHIFGFIMSFAYVFFGLLFIVTPFAQEIVADLQYRKILGAVLTAYGLFRVAYFLRQIRRKTH